MSARHAFESLLVRAMAGGARALGWPASRAFGARLGDAARALGLRRRVAEENLALAFPDRPSAERAAILREHYRELGRVALEYARLPALARAPDGEVVVATRGLEGLQAAIREGRGALLLTGHYGNFELLGAWLTRLNPVDFVVKPLSNPGVEAWISRQRSEAGVGVIPVGAGLRGVYASLRANRWVCLLADQDARRHGAFVPFFGRPASTPVGPAQIAIATGAALMMGRIVRRADGRYEIEADAPLPVPTERTEETVRALTARHTARLEQWVRERPELWFWLHRRWKTAPPS